MRTLISLMNVVVLLTNRTSFYTFDTINVKGKSLKSVLEPIRAGYVDKLPDHRRADI